MALWLGGVSALAVTTLELSAWYQPDESILGLTGEDYSRWSIFPLMLILYGLVGLHRHQSKTYGRLGWIGFAATFTGYLLLWAGEALSEVLFPLHHPLHTFGGAVGWLSLPVIIAGLAIWGVASLRSASLPIWAAPAPLAMALVWVSVRFPLHDYFLYNMPVWLGSVPVTRAVNAVGLGVLGFVLWSSDGSSSARLSDTGGVLDRT